EHGPGAADTLLETGRVADLLVQDHHQLARGRFRGEGPVGPVRDERPRVIRERQELTGVREPRYRVLRVSRAVVAAAEEIVEAAQLDDCLREAAKVTD